MSSATIGIDFGTTTSSMAWVDPRTGEAKVIKNAEGEEKTPSVVWFGADSVLVGTPAEQLLEDPDECQRVVQSIKRELISAPTLALPGRRVKAVEVAAAIFAKLKRDAEELHFHAPVDRAVVTCPAAFDVMEREAIEKAVRLAGFTEVRTLEEPVAAALAYSRAGLGVGRHVLVYDLGGGTFDLALLREEAGGFALAMEPKGLRRCGGDDFDAALYDWCDEEAERQWGQPLNGQGRDLKFLRECRKRKENLSVHDKVLFSSLVGEGRVLKHTLTRDQFENLILRDVDYTVRLTAELVRAAGGQGFPVDTVVLIGGSSRIPLVQRTLKEALPVAPEKWQHQDVAVALGAAYFAQGLWQPRPAVVTQGATNDNTKDHQARERAAAARQAVLTPEDIHGWSTEQVQVLQRTVAEALRIEAVFRDRLRDDAEGPEMVLIPLGSFLMGSPDGQGMSNKFDKPQHRVHIAKPFAIGRYAITLDEYDLFCIETARKKSSDSGWGRGRRPASKVSWEDAVAYCAWLARQTGLPYRLPSEAEWEYACRAGTTTRWSFGDEEKVAGEYSWFNGNSDNKTHPVGEKRPNPWNLYDMHGNVDEWVQDCWHGYTGAPSDGSAWCACSWPSSMWHVLRGGRFCVSPDCQGSAFRPILVTGYRSTNPGFRVVRTITG